MTIPEDEKPPEEKKERLQDKMSEKFDELKKNKNVEQMIHFAKSNTRDTVAYIALFVGIVLILFGHNAGSIIIGVVAGIYFGNDIITWALDFKSYLDGEGLVRSIILLGLGFAFLLSAPYIFLGLAATVLLKYLLSGPS